MLKNSDRSAIALHNDIHHIINRLFILYLKNKRVEIKKGKIESNRLIVYLGIGLYRGERIDVEYRKV